MRPKLALAALILLFAALPAVAGWTNNPLTGSVPVCASTGNQEKPRICALANGNTLIAWHDYSTPVTRADYQVLNSFGDPILAVNGQPIFDGNWSYGWGGSTVPNLIPDGQGGCIAVLVDNRDGSWDIYGQRFGAYGMPLWGPTGLPLAVWDGDEMSIQDFDANGMGDFFITFGANVAPQWPPDANLYAQKFDIDGNRLWGDAGTSISTAEHTQAYIKSVPDETGGLISIWADDRTQPNSSKLYTQHLNPQGNPLLTPNGEPILNQGSQISAPYLLDAVSSPNGGVWTWITSGQTNYFKVLRVSYTDSSYQVNWLNTSSYYPWHGFSGMLAHPVDGAIWLSYYDQRPGAPGTYLYRYDLEGNPTFGINGILYGGSMVPVSDGVITSGRYLDITPGVDVTNIISRRFNNSGQLIWQTVAVQGLERMFPIGNYAFGTLTSVSDGNDGAVITFEDRRQQQISDNDISAQRVLANGNLGNPEPPAINHTSPQRNMVSVGEGAIQFTLPSAGNVTLSLFDLLGRRVATLEEGYRTAGEHSVRFEQKGLPSGVYLLRLEAGGEAAVKKVVMMK